MILRERSRRLVAHLMILISSSTVVFVVSVVIVSNVRLRRLVHTLFVLVANIKALLKIRWGIRLVFDRTSEAKMIRNHSLSTDEQICAWSNYFGRKCKLLAVKDQSFTIRTDHSLAIAGGRLELVGSVQSLTIVTLQVLEVLKDFIVVPSDQLFCLVNSLLNLVNVVAQILHRFLKAFEGDHHLGLDLDSILVAALLKDVLLAIEVIHSFVKVGPG